jgi:hypothetical protein
MKIAILIEGETESVFFSHLRSFLSSRLAGRMPRLKPITYSGRIPKENKLRRVVENLLFNSSNPPDAVIALTDVYTGTNPPDFKDAADAKRKMREWVGENDRFYPHAAQYEFEAWLFPYWPEIQNLARTNAACPSSSPENVNHNRPPSHRLQDIFHSGNRGKSYIKTRDATRILRGKNLLDAARACPELKAFLNTILTLCGGDIIS